MKSCLPQHLFLHSRNSRSYVPRTIIDHGRYCLKAVDKDDIPDIYLRTN